MLKQIKTFFRKFIPAKCLNCSAKVKKSDNICHHCGIITPFSKDLCIQCRFPLDGKDSFCRNCGVKLILVKVTGNECRRHDEKGHHSH